MYLFRAVFLQSISCTMRELRLPCWLAFFFTLNTLCRAAQMHAATTPDLPGCCLHLQLRATEDAVRLLNRLPALTAAQVEPADRVRGSARRAAAAAYQAAVNPTCAQASRVTLRAGHAGRIQQPRRVCRRALPRGGCVRQLLAGGTGLGGHMQEVCCAVPCPPRRVLRLPEGLPGGGPGLVAAFHVAAPQSFAGLRLTPPVCLGAGPPA